MAKKRTKDEPSYYWSWRVCNGRAELFGLMSQDEAFRKRNALAGMPHTDSTGFTQVARPASQMRQYLTGLGLTMGRVETAKAYSEDERNGND